MSSPPAVAQPASLEVTFAVQQFLYREAQLLDDERQDEWFTLLSPEIAYQVPIRVTRERSKGAGFSQRAFHMDETYTSLQTRVRRLESEYAWAEDPPSRTRRFVTNVRAWQPDSARIDARSNLLLYRGRYDSPGSQLLAAERHDELVRLDGELKLARRVVLIDQTTLATHNLAVFL